MTEDAPQPTPRSAQQPAPQPLTSGHRLAELIGGYQVSAAIGALARLGVADALAQGPRAIGELARDLEADEGALARLLSATLDLGLFADDEGGRYRLTELGESLRSDVPGSMRRYAIVTTEDWRWTAYGHLAHTLRTGEPGFVAAHGCRLWDYLALHPEAAASFDESMARVGEARDRAVAAAIDLSAVDRLVDVGGGRGGLMSALLAANPRLRGVVFDLPAVAGRAAARLQDAGVAERCEIVAGDFREAVPAGGGVYVLAWILHDWDDAAAAHILRVCRAAMEEGTRLIVVEMVVPEPGRPAAEAFERLVRQADLEMLAVVGGRERRAAEYEQLLTDAGFALDRIAPLEGLPWSVIEGTGNLETPALERRVRRFRRPCALGADAGLSGSLTCTRGAGGEAVSDYDVIVIGTGVTGQTVAGELAAGRRVAIVDRREYGGTCALRGCEAKKVLIAAAEIVERAAAQAGNGPAGALRLDWPALVAFKNSFTETVPESTEAWLATAGVAVLHGEARFSGPDTLAVGDRELRAGHFVVATGARPAPLGIEGEGEVLSSEAFMSLERLGERVVFIGGGYISMEFAHIAAATGAAVTVCHRGAHVLGGFDPDLAAMLVAGYRAGGIDVRIEAPVRAVAKDGAALAVILESGERLACDMVVHGAGRIPDLEALDLATGRVAFGPRGIEVDERLRSVSNPRVWAAGDCAARGMPLTPVGIGEGRVVVRNIAGEEARWDPAVTPSVVFSDPPLASVGLTEAAARAQGVDFTTKLVDSSRWASSRRVGARVSGAKVLVERVSGRIVGAHLLGHNAEEVINVFAVAIAAGLTAADLKAMPWAYPTGGWEIVYLL